ncbi:MAG: bifunctional DNA-formamidopyrimidine glycosylase/DNA-(apurinic or apyrimidinic site) lyase [Candidatus Omnitrophica bacterium]|nr:bifunctional DNA-formamidopyrimidine glycosylase/DNA-(apurinic or apyrimidinic site) lyase [Candidatus Omnitrophota bacterium]
MPELPEIETIKRELKPKLLGKRITKVLIKRSRVIRMPSKRVFVDKIKHACIKSISRRGKALIFELSGPGLRQRFLVVHLRMSGQLIYPGDAHKARVSFKFSDGSMLDFNDQRLLGEIFLLDDWQELAFFKRLGPEPFDISWRDFSRSLQGRKAKIKPLLMDQSFIAGIGNIYAAEALFKARIAPQRKAQSLSSKEKNRLFKSITSILAEAIRRKGSSIDQYVRSDGKRGMFARQHKVYNRKGESCFVCRSPIKRIALAGRGTYFCSRCQR